MDGAHGAEELLGSAGLQQEPGGAVLDGGEHVGLVAEGGQDHRAGAAEAFEDLQARQSGHVEVDQGDVGPVPLGRGHRGAAVVDGGGDLHVPGRFEDGADALDDQRFVVGDQDPDHCETPRSRSSG
ncbi:hypothetical protein GCM10029992_04320 [Glycomyces albus]